MLQQVNIPKFPDPIRMGTAALFQRTDWYNCRAADASLSKPHVLPVVPSSRAAARV